MLDKVYLLSHPSFITRREYITDKLSVEIVNFEMVENYSPEEIDTESYTKNYEDYLPIIIYQVKHYSYYNKSNKISPSSLSLVLKHIHCWKNQLENDFEYTMIVEDDCEIPNNFKDLLERVLDETKEGNFDIVMLGGFSDFISPNISPNRLIHYHPFQKTRCTHCYIINRNAAKIMIDGFVNINNPIDIKMNEVIQLNNLKVAWLEPGLKQIEFK